MALSFDATYYLSARPDVFHAFVATAGTTGKTWAEFAEEHYNTFGRFEGANPNATFNTDEYLAANPDVAAAGVNPFTHYLHFGAAEGRAPSDSFPSFASFDYATYLAANSDLGEAGIDTAEEAYAHFVIFGQFEGRAGAPDVDTGVPGSNFTLTVGADKFVGTNNNDTFVAAETSGKTWTVGDAIDGGAGNDTFNVTQTAAITAPVGATVKNIETANLLSGTTGNNVNTTSWTGLTELNVTGVTQQTVTAAATTDVSVTGSAATGATAVNGGKNVTVTVSETSGGGAPNTGTVNVGATTAAAGIVTVNSTIAVDNASEGNNITVKGGSEINITQKGANAVNTTVVDGIVTVTGDANTKAVTVTSDKAAAASATVVGRTNAAVGITDVNAASATAAGVIETVSVTNAGAVIVNSGALKTLNLGGTITSVNASTLGALTKAANTELAVNANGLTTTGAVMIDSDITTLNLAGNTAATTIASLVANGAKTLNIAGDAKVTLTAQTLGALTDVVVTNTAGASLGTAIGAGVTFTGGAGDDSVSLSNGFTKAINMGAGNDTVIYGGAAGTGGSVNAGDGEDTIVMSGAEANAASADATFNTKFTGFEVLSVETGANLAVDLVGINGVSKVTTLGANGLILNNMATGGTLTLTGASTGVIVNVRDAAFNPADVLNVALSNSTAASVAFGTVTAANVETINISTVDAGTGANAAATVDTATLVATGATKIVVSGNNGLNLTNVGNTAVTSFDASGVVGDDATDTAANLAVTFVSANNTATANVSITGGAGNDVLTGGDAKDTIIGGAGNDTITGGKGVDTLTGGEGADIFVFAAGDAGITGGEKITDFSTALGGDKLDLATTTLIANVTDANVTGAVGGAVDVTATVKDGMITLGGADAGLVNTVGHIKAIFEMLDADDTAEVGAIVLNGLTYVLTDAASGGGADSVNDIIQLVGVTGAVSLSTVDAANSIFIG